MGGRAIAVRALLCVAVPQAGCHGRAVPARLCECRKGICILNTSWCSFTASEQLPQQIRLQHTYSRLRLGAADSRYLGRPSTVPVLASPPGRGALHAAVQPLPCSPPLSQRFVLPLEELGQAGTWAPPPCPLLTSRPLMKAASHRCHVLGQALPESWQPPGSKGRGTELQGAW